MEKEEKLAQKTAQLKALNTLLNMDQKDYCILDDKLEKVPQKTMAPDYAR